jgi:hypothetical protein
MAAAATALAYDGGEELMCVMRTLQQQQQQQQLNEDVNAVVAAAFADYDDCTRYQCTSSSAAPACSGRHMTALQTRCSDTLRSPDYDNIKVKGADDSDNDLHSYIWHADGLVSVPGNGIEYTTLYDSQSDSPKRHLYRSQHESQQMSNNENKTPTSGGIMCGSGVPWLFSLADTAAAASTSISCSSTNRQSTCHLVGTAQSDSSRCLLILDDVCRTCDGCNPEPDYNGLARERNGDCRPFVSMMLVTTSSSSNKGRGPGGGGGGKSVRFDDELQLQSLSSDYVDCVDSSGDSMSSSSNNSNKEKVKATVLPLKGSHKRKRNTVSPEKQDLHSVNNHLREVNTLHVNRDSNSNSSRTKTSGSLGRKSTAGSGSKQPRLAAWQEEETVRRSDDLGDTDGRDKPTSCYGRRKTSSDRSDDYIVLILIRHMDESWHPIMDNK